MVYAVSVVSCGCNAVLGRELGKPEVQHVLQRAADIWFDIEAHNAANLQAEINHVRFTVCLKYKTISHAV